MCGIIRTYELQGLSSKSDYSYDTVSLVIWSASELLITIICANIPMIRPLWAKVRGKRSTQGDDLTPDASHELQNPPTIGSARQGNRKHSHGVRSRELKGEWSELGDEEFDDSAAMASRLAGPRQGKTSTVVKGSFLRSRTDSGDDDARSSESILREDRGAPAPGGGIGIAVQRDYEVRGASISTAGGGGGRGW